MQDAVPGHATNATVLVIEDDEFVRRLVERVLSQEGYRVLCAPNGQAGVALFRAQRDTVSCIMLDATLPDLQGTEALRQLLEIRNDIPVVLATGRSADEVAPLQAMSSLVNYLMKPFAPAEIVAGVRLAIGAGAARPT